MNTRVDGTVAPGFEEVRAEFERNFAERGEIGAAVAAYWRGEKVVDLKTEMQTLMKQLAGGGGKRAALSGLLGPR